MPGVRLVAPRCRGGRRTDGFNVWYEREVDGPRLKREPERGGREIGRAAVVGPAATVVGGNNGSGRGSPLGWGAAQCGSGPGDGAAPWEGSWEWERYHRGDWVVHTKQLGDLGVAAMLDKALWGLPRQLLEAVAVAVAPGPRPQEAAVAWNSNG